MKMTLVATRRGVAQLTISSAPGVDSESSPLQIPQQERDANQTR